MGGREIGFLFGQYKRLRNEFTGVLTGKGLNWGGSLIRPEATGYGAVYFAAEMLKTRGETLEGKTCLVSGSGNVAQYTVEKLIQLGAKPVTLSDSDGYIYDEDGIDAEKLAFVMDLKNVRRGRIKEYADKFKGVVYTPIDPKLDHNPLWNHTAHCAFPSATQNEINGKDAQNLVKNGVYVVSEGANMPTDARRRERVPASAKILYGPGKAANAGGVATSGLEMSQNSLRLSWTREEVDQRLHGIMKAIHKAAYETADRVRRAGQLRERRQHRRLPQGRRRDDGPGAGVDRRQPASGSSIGRAARARLPRRRPRLPHPPSIRRRLAPSSFGRFRGFQDLAQHRIENILLVSSLYDSFILAEDGQLGELILGEFLDLSFRHSPGITRVSSGAEALALARERAPLQPDHHVDARRRHGRARRSRAGVQEAGLDIPVVLLAYDTPRADRRSSRATTPPTSSASSCGRAT